jgi:hypothetical protein
MSAASNYLEAKLLDHALGTTTFTKPSAVYVALFTGSAASNLEAGTLSNEITTSGSAYARQTATFAAASSPGGTATTNATITFPTATASWGTVSYLAIMDSDTEGSGNVLFYGALDSSKLIETGDTFQIQSGNLTVTLA